MEGLFKTSTNFVSLSLKDLIEARELFHYHLINKKNVVATALGLYRIRKDESWPDAKTQAGTTTVTKPKGRRTLFNSEVRPYSWPCVYVFVAEWEEEDKLAKQQASDVVPKSLYLPDGRVVPVCIIEAKKQSMAQDTRVNLKSHAPRNLIGPGTPIINEKGQGVTRVATAGCIVKDAETYYLMTNRHAVGISGTPIKAVQPHRSNEIGVTVDLGLTRENFRTIYPNFPSTNQYLLMDVGLVELNDITQWKTDFPGIAQVEPVLDLYDNNLTLQLIGKKVVGQSAVTGTIRGEIQGLFYRFKAMGGSEYISDFLIGPESHGDEIAKVGEGAVENRSLQIHHGDSGTILLIEHQEKTADGKVGKKTYHPFAMLWGKQQFLENGKELVQPFALATSLSTTLDRLGLDLVRDLNMDQDYVWGWVGHYAIGGLLPEAIGLLPAQSELARFVQNNIDLLTVDPDDALGNDPKVRPKDVHNDNHPLFVPLADVPDNVWKGNVNFYTVKGADGKNKRVPGFGNRGHQDNLNHFADMDLPYGGEDTFIEYMLKNLDELKPEVWIDYYEQCHEQFDQWAQLLGEKPKPISNHWGALPFRVWQLFDAMKVAKNPEEFLCAGGVLIHYLGDACQPLHCSIYNSGNPNRVVPKPIAEGNKLEADGVHGGYEDDMIDYGYQEQALQKKLKAAVKRQETDPSETIDSITSGKEAAQAVIKLIGATRDTIDPEKIVDKWVELIGTKKSDKAPLMWQEFGDDTVECMARGARYLAAIWTAAWEVKDKKIAQNHKCKREDIQDLYDEPDFVKSVRLDEYSDILSSDLARV